MSNLMPCGLDDPDLRFEPDEPDTDPRTDMEKRLSWICSDWNEAIEIDMADAWRDLRMSLYGATQTINCSPDRYWDGVQIRHLAEIAQWRTLDCISRGRYEK